ncbi:hypothetical protein ETD86_34770 [Nonomuraea turkmeniaca]|uniref:Uncharacterized protein n=1 Tax=Nonomuraea turkmeniaca TaxID=103838 RepID=A0A5S4F6D6_9ACTN|nr:hypothetical protein [Nonomuraea turkmeniaca]TMR11735.1 hypothetical protein ETD86_34770 [Nonomuraea turkmeniaca]
MSYVHLVTEDLRWVAAYWEDLTEARLPGTARPWRHHDLTTDQQQERDRQAWEERLDRSSVAPGEHPAPLDLGILDTMLDVLVRADDLAAAIAQHVGVEPLAPPRLGDTDARPYLEFAAQHLADDFTFHAAPVARTMVTQVAHALALVFDGQRLDVECPWCRGITPDTPAGGARTWRVRELPGNLIAIVCENLCEPPSKDVGTWWRGSPVWPLAEWDWLAKRVEQAETKEKISA